MKSIALPLVFLLAGTGCTHQGAEQGEMTEMDQGISLAETTWRLAEIAEHPGDAALVGEVEAGLYTLVLDPDGRAAFRLDCNRGFGRWQGTVLEKQASGQLSFSQIGVTKALCAPDSISDAVTADLARFDTFSLKGEQLVLSDAEGTLRYVWKPAELEGERGGE
ncbi:MAG: META domain-containing protein [Erythrobacter sp.]|uniref:META domain-containing protein n=1 Tax=Erythrobacter sp. TaxID=1042 RepID=UPI0032EFB02C